MLCIHNGWVLPMTADGAVIRNGYVLVREERIAAVGEGNPRAELEAQSGAAAESPIKMIDAQGGIIMPGMINTHTHIAMALFRSLADDRKDRLRTVLFPLESIAVNEQLVYDASRHALVELIQGGVTTFADMYYFEEQCARATHQAGLRAVLGETVVDFIAPDTVKPYEGIERTREFAERWRDDALITASIAPHAPYTVDDAHLRECVSVAEELDIPMMLHLAEMPYEVERIHKEHGVSPVRRMADLGVLGRRLTAAHCVFTDEADHALLQQSGTGAAVNTVANMKAGKGFAPLAQMIDAGVRVGLGTDGPMSGNTLDMFGPMRAVATVYKGILGDPAAFPARQAVELATIGAARALHMEDRIGSLEPGKQADIAVVSTSAPSVHPVHDPWSVLVYGASPRDVDTTIAAGRVLMHRREISHMDTAAIARRSDEAGAEAGRLLSGLQDTPATPRRGLLTSLSHLRNPGGRG